MLSSLHEDFVFLEYECDTKPAAVDLVKKGFTHHIVATWWTPFQSCAYLEVSRKFRMQILVAWVEYVRRQLYLKVQFVPCAFLGSSF